MRGALLATTVFAIATVALLGALPLWMDEIIQLIETRDTSTAQMISQLPRNSGAVPLGYLAQQSTLKVIGYSIRKARVPAALFGIATVFAVALLAVELGIQYAWISAALFAIFPEGIRYATEARVYSQALFFSVFATLLYVRLAKEPTLARAAAYCLALLAAIYTQPYAGSVAIAHILWSISCREFRTVRFGAAALAIAVAAFLPWYLWSRAGWAAGIALEGFRFTASIKAPLMVFREVAGAGYWGSGLLVILCTLGVMGRRPSARAQSLLLFLIGVPLVSVFAADAIGNYFLASRQFIWILPAVAILAASAFESHSRAAAILTALLVIVCVRQTVRFYTLPHDDYQAAAAALMDQARNGACLMVDPPVYTRYYEFFQTELRGAQCGAAQTARNVVLAIPPTIADPQREAAVTARKTGGYVQDSEARIGGSSIVVFHRAF